MHLPLVVDPSHHIVVRDRTLVEYAETREPVTRILAADGPSVRTVARWVQQLETKAPPSSQGSWRLPGASN